MATLQNIPTIEPTEFAAGDSVFWDKYLADFSAEDGWNLTYSLKGPSGLELTSTQITASGAGWQVRVPATTTTNLPPGRYTWVSYVTSGTERHQAERGVFNVTENFAELADFISDNQKKLDILNAAIDNRLTADTESFQINGRAVNKTPIADLHTLRGIYEQRVWQEQNPGVAFPSTEVAFVSN